MKYNFKPCPFCGNRPFMGHNKGIYESYYVYCGNEDCPAPPQTRRMFTPEEAEDLWNTRIGESASCENCKFCAHLDDQIFDICCKMLSPKEVMSNDFCQHWHKR